MKRRQSSSCHGRATHCTATGRPSPPDTACQQTQDPVSQQSVTRTTTVFCLHLLTSCGTTVLRVTQWPESEAWVDREEHTVTCNSRATQWIVLRDCSCSHKGLQQNISEMFKGTTTTLSVMFFKIFAPRSGGTPCVIIGVSWILELEITAMIQRYTTFYITILSCPDITIQNIIICILSWLVIWIKDWQVDMLFTSLPIQQHIQHF